MLILLVAVSCESHTSIIDDSTRLDVLDSLQGNWLWHATMDPKKGLIKNEFKFEIRLRDIEGDSVILYETYKNDTLKEKSKIRIIGNTWGRRIEPKIITQFTVENTIYFKFLSKDTIQLYERCDDCPIYYYSKSIN